MYFHPSYLSKLVYSLGYRAAPQSTAARKERNFVPSPGAISSMLACRARMALHPTRSHRDPGSFYSVALLASRSPFKRLTVAPSNHTWVPLPYIGRKKVEGKKLLF